MAKHSAPPPPACPPAAPPSSPTQVHGFLSYSLHAVIPTVLLVALVGMVLSILWKRKSTLDTWALSFLVIYTWVMWRVLHMYPLCPSPEWNRLVQIASIQGVVSLGILNIARIMVSLVLDGMERFRAAGTTDES